jgi:HD superfamily phosphodiesterase
MGTIFKKDYNELIYKYDDNIEYIRHKLYRKIKSKLYMKMSIVKLIETIIDNFESEFCEDNKEVLKRKIINHSNRVYRNMKLIVANLELNDKIFLSKRDKFVLSVSCLLHDIGKVYKDKDHNIYSTIMVDYLLRLDKRFDEDLINDILDVIYNHSKKTKKKSKISILSKIMRDADLFDEECGDSLFYLLIGISEFKKSNLNKIKIKEAKLLLYSKRDQKHKDEIKSKINTPGGYELYEKLLSEAAEKFYMFLDTIDDLKIGNEYYDLDYLEEDK